MAQFFGQSPDWYKLALIIFLIVNPLIFLISPFVAGWLLVAEFIFTLAMALKCYPLLPGGLLAIEAVFIGMTSAEHVREEVAANLEVLLLLMFMVAGIYFMKQLLLFIFTRLLLSIRSKMLLSLSFCVAAAFLSAFLEALTARGGGDQRCSRFLWYLSSRSFLPVPKIPTCKTIVISTSITKWFWNSSVAFCVV